MARRGESLELAVLGLLHEVPMHGYELRKRLNLMLGWGRVLSYGTLYPALKKLLRAGLIAETPVPGGAAAVVSRRQRIVYEITDAGEQHFKELVNEVGPSAWEDGSFDVRFAFFSRTDLSSRLRILEGRRSRLQERLDRVQAQIDRTQRDVDRYAVELQRHGLESVQREVSWLSELIAAEHARQLAPEGPQQQADQTSQSTKPTATQE
ncbi:PadR family transcriptional regulator [Nocardioides massiliensis]|uniref:DNA-binding PadR family transcriptional regulator n=1 Tax=Nocardioides massiliensis TaxID=1325935 RepID=A0ABT9NLN8_9ACTN|nr:PadR family transcriptional regulator [Nocardioides massiliensis]MDP9821337.1 DNA-binding PadR family transcriptional regulator [Nocardioides massiliensis]